MLTVEVPTNDRTSVRRLSGIDDVIEEIACTFGYSKVPLFGPPPQPDG